MTKAFTLVEILIVVAIMGILAAMIMPAFQGHLIEARESAAKDNLRVLRNAIGVYATHNNGVAPGYPGNHSDIEPVGNVFVITMRGKYLNTLPENPFNGKTTMLMINNDMLFPAEPTGQYGWVYQPWTKTIKLDWPGTDRTGMRYYDY